MHALGVSKSIVDRIPLSVNCNQIIEQDVRACEGKSPVMDALSRGMDPSKFGLVRKLMFVMLRESSLQ